MTPARKAGWTGPAMLALLVAALAGGLAYSYATIADMRAAQASVDQTRDALQAFDARLRAGATPPGTTGGPPADPFLPGDSASLASANLQDLVVSAIRRAGGTVTSSQVQPEEASADGSGPATGAASPIVSLDVTCLLGDGGVQGLLYDLEAHTPTVFVTQLTIDAGAEPRSGGAEGAAPLKVSLTVAGYWNAGVKS